MNRNAPASNSLARNALTGGGRFLIGALMALLVTPYALDTLGDTRFGIWALAGVLLALLRMLDLGIARALTRRIAEARGADALSEAGPALTTARVLVLGIGVAATLLIVAASSVLVTQVFAIPASLAEEARWVMMGTALVAAVELAFSPYPAALDGIGRMDLSNMVDGLVQRLLSPLGVVLVLAAGGGLVGLVAKNLFTATLAGLACRRLLAKEREGTRLISAPGLEPVGYHPSEARNLLGFGRHVQLVNLGSALVEPFAKTLLGRLNGLDVVAVYELAARVAGQLGGACMALQNALFPAAAEASASGSRDAYMTLYRSAGRYLGAATLWLWASVIALAQPFAFAWVGPDYPALPLSIQILALGWSVALLALPAFLVAQAGGQHGTSTTGGLTTSLVSLALIAYLAPAYGLLGVVGGVSAGLASGGVVTLGLFARRHDLGPSTLLPISWRVWFSVIVGALVAGGLARALPPGLGFVAMSAVFGSFVSGLFLIASGEIDTREQEMLRNFWEQQLEMWTGKKGRADG